MSAEDFHELPDHDDWLEHIDTVVLSREQEAELDRPAERPAPERKPNEV